MTRRLRVSRETLADLTPEELSGVAGGAITIDGCPIGTFPLLYCITLGGPCD
jgi:hypothetical protein